MPSMQTTITRDEIENGEPVEVSYDIEVDYERSRYYPATGPSWSSPGEPAEGGEITILCAWWGREVFPLTDGEIAYIEDEIWALGPEGE